MDDILAPLELHQESIKEITSVWGLSHKHTQQVQEAVTRINMKHGLFANLPIICKGTKCPYKATCTLPEEELPVNNRCPLEIGAIISRFERYCTEFEVTEKDAVDLGQIKQLVDVEVMLLRCDSKIALSADFVEDNIVNVTEDGTEIYKTEITQPNLFKMTLIERHSRILKDLAATRNMRNNTDNQHDASKISSMLMQRIKDISESQGVSSKTILNASYEVDFDEDVINEDDYIETGMYSEEGDD